MKLTIPELSLVVLIGASGSGKSRFARKHFKPTEVLSSDYCRGLVSDDENNQAATTDAFEVLHFIARKRLAAGKLTVVDATSVQSEFREPLVELAREFHCLPVAIVLNLPEKVCHELNQNRSDREFGPHVVRQQVQQLRRSLRGLQREGFRHVFVLNSMEEVDTAIIERQPLWNNLKADHDPFDIIGDIHGCYDELVALLVRLGYEVGEMSSGSTIQAPAGRKLIFLGDLVDRGPKIPQVLKLVMNAVESGVALCVPGNHDMKLMRKLRGRDEVMSRFAANPKWLIYLPPTMSPSETTQEPGLLEHPTEAFAYYRHEGVPKVICEQKHMGSRAVVIVCRDEESTRKRFGVVGEGVGICYTRTGRRFFEDAKLEAELLNTVRSALDRASFWDDLKTDWVCLDCELMPWSAKAQALIKEQYAAVGAAAQAALAGAVECLTQAARNSAEVKDLLARHQERQKLTQDYVRAYQQYCWPVGSLAELKLAPFHLLATEGQVHVGKDHVWQMEALGKVCAADSALVLATPFKIVDVTDAKSQSSGVQWWEKLTGSGGEGMVVKPLDFVARGRKGLVQPAVKCRGREYLRIIYGPEYTLPENLERLRTRGLSAKRSLAIREFALGIEALERFVRQEPLRRVHECVFGVLAFESEPVDPRL